uniref:Uncharacterized protein n=1 Tax=Rhabditophanes sp. KR3021 TaxID=114890 RepID=A0AC35U8G7_9BILA
MKFTLLILLVSFFYINAKSSQIISIQNIYKDLLKVEANKPLQDAEDKLTCILQFTGSIAESIQGIEPIPSQCETHDPCVTVTGKEGDEVIGFAGCASLITKYASKLVNIPIPYDNVCKTVPITYEKQTADATFCFCITDKCNDSLKTIPDPVKPTVSPAPTSAPIKTTTQGSGTNYLSAILSISSIISYLFVVNH